MADTQATPTLGFDTIRKGAPGDPPPNLPKDEAARATFDWSAIEARLDGLPDGRGLNLAHEAVDRHADGPRADQVALRWLSADHEVRDFSYAELGRRSARFANVLERLGVEVGERVFIFLGRVPDLYIAMLGTLKRRGVVAPLFSAFGPDPVRQRMEIGDGRVVVTSPTLYRRKLAKVRDRLPGLKHILLATSEGEPFPEGLPDDVHDLRALMDDASDAYEIGPTDPESLALLHFTSGTTGLPKGAMHVHRAALHHYMTGLYALDFHDGDVFWCTADPGWVTGTSYGVLAPLMHGLTNVVDEAEFDAERWYRTIQEQRITVWYTAPTAVRMLMKVGSEVAWQYDLSSLRFIGSVGEPLNPEAVVWGNETFGMPIHDNWWQTETGGIMIANTRAMDVKPGSMGRPLPGIEAGVVERRADGGVELVTDPTVPGELALRPGWPSMFRGYLNREEKYRASFADGWYLTGDLAKRDEDGYFWFVGRADDLIKSAGHLIGPFEVESALIEHPAVAEAGVIGIPDEVAGELVKAFVTLTPGYEPSEELTLELLGHARKRLGPAVAPKSVEIRDELPHTRSGKIMRRLLKARELGLPEGDISTLENVPNGGEDATG